MYFSLYKLRSLIERILNVLYLVGEGSNPFVVMNFYNYV